MDKKLETFNTQIYTKIKEEISSTGKKLEIVKNKIESYRNNEKLKWYVDKVNRMN